MLNAFGDDFSILSDKHTSIVKSVCNEEYYVSTKKKSKTKKQNKKQKEKKWLSKTNWLHLHTLSAHIVIYKNVGGNACNEV